jgi:hypothetical protein
MHSKVPLILLKKPENVFNIQPSAVALLVDLEGTLTEFCPSLRSVVEAISHFDEIAKRNGIDLQCLHYVTNANLDDSGASVAVVPTRLHHHAFKPFYTPSEEFRSHGYGTVVIGDQYLTDGLLAWRFGFSFCLVNASYQRPTWPQVQLSAGRALAPLFFRMVK